MCEQQRVVVFFPSNRYHEFSSLLGGISVGGQSKKLGLSSHPELKLRVNRDPLLASLVKLQ